MRGFLKYLLASLGGLLVFVALGGVSLWFLIGTADRATTTVMTALSSDSDAKVAGSWLIEEIAGNADPAVRARIQGEQALLSEAAVIGLRASESTISAAIHAAYEAVQNQSLVVIDLEPVITNVVAEMHARDSAIPDTADEVFGAGAREGVAVVEVNGAALGAIRAALSILSQWWIPIVAALALLLLAGACDRRGPVRRWRISGIALAIPSGLLVLLSFAGDSTRAGDIDSDSLGLITSFVSVEQGILVWVSGVAFVIALTVIVLTFVLRPTKTARRTSAASNAKPSAVASSEATSSWSAEALDEIVATTRPRLWIALVSLLALIALGVGWIFLGRIPLQVEAQGVVSQPDGSVIIPAPVTGAVDVVVASLTDVAKGDTLAFITPFNDDPKTTIVAAGPGTITSRLVQNGQGVQAGEGLFVLDAPNDSNVVRILAFPTSQDVERFKPGQLVTVSVGSIQSQGTVVTVSAVPIGARSLEAYGVQPLRAADLLANSEDLLFPVVISVNRTVGSDPFKDGEIAFVTNTYEIASPASLMFRANS
jgi:hypothetical protein